MRILNTSTVLNWTSCKPCHFYMDLHTSSLLKNMSHLMVFGKQNTYLVCYQLKRKYWYTGLKRFKGFSSSSMKLINPIYLRNKSVSTLISHSIIKPLPAILVVITNTFPLTTGYFDVEIGMRL